MLTRSVAEELAVWLEKLDVSQIPASVRSVAANLFLDSTGLCVAARGSDYLRAASEAWEGSGPCTVVGMERGLDAAGAALLNGVAIHGEDFDDSFEGSPLHAGAAAIPAVLAACERYRLSGADLLRGLTAALEAMCRLTLVAPGAIHQANFHPASVIGCIGAAVGTGVALSLSAKQLVYAMGIAGSLACGIMEFLAEGAWTKRLQPGWAAQAGLRAALMGRHGFVGPRTVFEGAHGYFKAFTPSADPDFTQLLGGLGDVWRMEGIVFKLYPCGTPIGPYIDCAKNLAARGVKPDEIAAVVCKVAEPVIRRQWEPLAQKRRPANPFAAKFSGPFGLALGFIEGKAGLGEYSQEKITNPEILSFMDKIRYELDSDSEYPRNYTGHLRALLKDGTVCDITQPHLRGGRREPVSRDELIRKFEDNVLYGGWSKEQAGSLLSFCDSVFELPNLDGLAFFRN